MLMMERVTEERSEDKGGVEREENRESERRNGRREGQPTKRRRIQNGLSIWAPCIFCWVGRPMSQ